MTASLSLSFPHAGSSKAAERGLRSRQRLRPSLQPRTTPTLIRAVTSDFPKRTKIDSSPTGKSPTSPTTAPSDPLASPSDLSLLPPYRRTHKSREQEIPSDALGKGSFVKNKLIYRQIFGIRSYEVGFDKTASIETITKLFQETSLNHVGTLDFVGDGMGTTHAMMSKRLIWVVTRMHIEMVQYPTWGDVVQIESWVSSSGKNGMRRDFLIQDCTTGLILGRATSNWALMNQDTRKLSKMPEDVRAEISTQFFDHYVIDKDDTSLARVPLLDESAPFKRTNLTPKFYDLDMNKHVNNVKYIEWVLESLPRSLLMSCDLTRLTLEYRRECGSCDVLESLGQSNMTSNLDNPRHTSHEDAPLGFTHLLRLCGSNCEVLRARTQWRVKQN